MVSLMKKESHSQIYSLDVFSAASSVFCEAKLTVAWLWPHLLYRQESNDVI